MYNPTAQRNIASLNTWFIPIIIVAKIVRWTLMYEKLVLMSIGNGMAYRIVMGNYSHLKFAVLSEASSGTDICENNSGFVLNLLNIFGVRDVLGWEIFITILFNIFLYFFCVDFYKTTPTAKKWENLFVYLGIAILNIFCFCLSKEPYQMLFFFLMAWGIKKGKTYRQKSIYLGAAIFLTVLLARKYYALVLFYFIIINYLVRFLYENIDFSTKQGMKKLLLNSIFAACIMGVAYLFVVSYFAAANEEAYQGMVIANYRSTITSFVSDSEITPLFSSKNPLLMSMDYTIKIFRLLMPIELILRGKVTYLFMIGFQCLLIYFIAQAFVSNNLNKEDAEEEEDEEEEEMEETEDVEETEIIEEDEEVDDEEEEEEDEEEEARKQDRQDTRRCALYLYLAFLLCSAAFEPDFGSWIRHQGVTLPILLLIL